MKFFKAIDGKYPSAQGGTYAEPEKAEYREYLPEQRGAIAEARKLIDRISAKYTKNGSRIC